MWARSRPQSSAEIETSVELKLDEAKSTAQFWEALPNYDAIYADLHPLDYGSNVLMRVVVHWYSFAHLGARQVAFFSEVFDNAIQKMDINKFCGKDQKKREHKP